MGSPLLGRLICTGRLLWGPGQPVRASAVRPKRREGDRKGRPYADGCTANMRLYCLDVAAFWMVDEAQAQEVVVRGQGQFLVACYDMLGIGRHRLYRF